MKYPIKQVLVPILAIIVSIFFIASCTTGAREEKKSDIVQSGIHADTSNYYSYYSNGDNLKGTIETAWLKDYEINPILLQEMEKAGFGKNQKNVLYQISPSQTILLTAYSVEPEFGFIYIEDHDAFPLKSHRDRISTFQEYDSCVYEQGIRVPGAILKRIQFKKMPSNIYLLQSDCYWYQSSDSIAENQHLLSKDNAIEIFEQDVRKILSGIKKD